VIGQKQDHYLMPLMPPLAILTAAWIAQANRNAPVARIIFIVTFAITLIGGLALPLVARRLRAEVLTPDIATCAALGLGSIAVAIVWRRRGWHAGLVGYAALVFLMIGPLLSVLWPTVKRPSPRDLAAHIRARAGGGPYCFYGDNFSLPLVYAMRTIIPQAKDASNLSKMSAAIPSLVVIAQTKSDREPPDVPAGFVQIDQIQSADQKFELFKKP
jgi:4-amino-4-deoxy-L-arabinose transferase-like glycosyltransferase